VLDRKEEASDLFNERMKGNEGSRATKKVHRLDKLSQTGGPTNRSPIANPVFSEMNSLSLSHFFSVQKNI